jgi:hypothetical protein
MLVDHRNMWKICQGQEIRFKKKKEREKKRKASAVPREIVIIALSGYMYVMAKANASREIESTDEIAWQAERGAESCRAFRARFAICSSAS